MNVLIRHLILAGLVWAGLGLGLNAAEPPAGPPAPATASTARLKAFPFRGRIAAVDLDARTLTLKGKAKDRVFLVTEATRILKQGKPATLADAKVGEEAGGQAQLTGEGQQTMISLRLGPKPELAGKGKSIPSTEEAPSEMTR